jgi:GGDEF domain-containing protein
VENEGGSLSNRMIAIWLSVGTAFLTLVLVLAGLLKPPENITEGGLDFLLAPSQLRTGVWIAGVVAVALVFSAIAIWVRRDGERRIARIAREKADLEQELRHTKGTLAQTEHLMVTDPITGIPNFRSWQRHAAAWPLTDGATKPSCLILIDLDKLGALNNVSHACANRVLELFATRTYYSMRRNEHAFKIPNKDAPREIEDQVEMFRHYAGGDEFCFHMLDNVTAALGSVPPRPGPWIGARPRSIRESKTSTARWPRSTRKIRTRVRSRKRSGERRFRHSGRHLKPSRSGSRK